MGFVEGLLFGVVIGVVFTAIAIGAKSKNVFTNADRLALDTDGLADLIYRADDVSTEICRAEFGDEDEIIHCRYPDEDGGCKKCIKEWLNKEVNDMRYS